VPDFVATVPFEHGAYPTGDAGDPALTGFIPVQTTVAAATSGTVAAQGGVAVR
jgi:hypothetical protein